MRSSLLYAAMLIAGSCPQLGTAAETGGHHHARFLAPTIVQPSQDMPTSTALAEALAAAAAKDSEAHAAAEATATSPEATVLIDVNVADSARQDHNQTKVFKFFFNGICQARNPFIFAGSVASYAACQEKCLGDCAFFAFKKADPSHCMTYRECQEPKAAEPEYRAYSVYKAWTKGDLVITPAPLGDPEHSETFWYWCIGEVDFVLESDPDPIWVWFNSCQAKQEGSVRRNMATTAEKRGIGYGMKPHELFPISSSSAEDVGNVKKAVEAAYLATQKKQDAPRLRLVVRGNVGLGGRGRS